MSNVQVTVTANVEGTEVEAVDFHRVRANGTTRHIATDTDTVETGLWVLAQREEGKTMKAIAAEMHVSVPTVRRLINSALLVQEVEDGDWDETIEEAKAEALAPVAEAVAA